jgi:ubiquinone/menaquinone biosynthesis C-methylase UbiE
MALDGRKIADIGCGDGIMALGVSHQARPAQLIGFDINLTDSEYLLGRARAEGVAAGLPAGLEFRQSTPLSTPAPDDEFDFVYSWSAFEHIAEPISVLAEIRRILRPEGVFFLQLWPFYLSARGSHLWDWFPDEFHQLRENHQDVVAQMGVSDRHSVEWTHYMANEFERLNRITLQELQRAVLAGGFDVRRLELISLPTALTPELGRYSWADLAVSGVKLAATLRP